MRFGCHAPESECPENAKLSSVGMLRRGRDCAFLGIVLLGCASGPAAADVIKGTLKQDDVVFSQSINLSGTSNLTIFTTSYGGGTNLNGTTTPSGGFEPILSLFSPSGAFIADDGGDLQPFGAIDPTTHTAGDASLHLSGLVAGTYTLALTEFFNYPNGNLPDGFFQTGQGNFTGPTCSQPGASFLQVDLVACPQRTANFAVNIAATPVPEPNSWTVLAAGLSLGVFMVGRRRTRKTR